MKFSISKLELFPSLQQVVGVVERKQTHEVMYNLLFEASDDSLQMTGTDNEVELQTRIPLIVTEPGKTTIPARKLFDICRSLDDNARLDFEIDTDKAKIRCGKSRFTLATLPVDEFPLIGDLADTVEVSLPQKELETAIKRTSFAMAQQDVRYYLNGLLLQLNENELCCVSTDGHRLALHKTEADIETTESVKAIIPRKAITELSRLMDGSDTRIDLSLNEKHLRIRLGALQMTTKLVEGKFPDYEKVIPLDSSNIAGVDRELFRQSLTRSAILANETYKGVRLMLENQSLGIQTNNPKHEEAEDELEIDYSGDPIEIAFNVVYLLDVLNAVDSESVELNIKDNTSSMVIHPGDAKKSTYVVMPMRL
ncbi:MAG: DNA polymerase III subunit beta [Pseudomonadota bacterium]